MLVIFDMDGVLLDTRKAKLEAFRKTFSHFNIVCKRSTLELLSTNRPSKILFEYYKQNSEIYTFYKRCYEHLFVNSKMFVDLDSLKALKLQGFTLALFTLQPKSRVESYFNQSDLKIFDAIVTEEDVRKNGKSDSHGIQLIQEKTSEVRSLFVGDSPGDILTARQAGIPSIFVTWGYYDQKEINKYNPNFVVDNPKELLSLISRFNEEK